jgi:hypothetical protein
MISDFAIVTGRCADHGVFEHDTVSADTDCAAAFRHQPGAIHDPATCTNPDIARNRCVRRNPCIRIDVR